MESLSNMYRRARRNVSYIFEPFSSFLRLLLQALAPLWFWLLRVPGVELLCRRALLFCLKVQNFASLTWRGSRNEPSEKNQEKNRYSSDEEEGKSLCSGDPYSGSPYSGGPYSGGPERSGKPSEVKVENEFAGHEYRVDDSDDFYCEYDSTWEAEHEKEGPPRRKSYLAKRNRPYQFTRFENAAKDMQNYRHGYPNLHRTRRFEEGNDEKPNLSFYLGEMASLPDGIKIEQFHNEWKQDYDKLEHVHSYIQWLFPLQEPGVNYEATTLTKQEIQDFLGNKTAKENLLKSYELMLDFYGIMLKDKDTGEVARAENWSDRFQNLNNHTHNNLRITRILKCLGTLGYRHYQVPLVRFFLQETMVNGELPRVKDSALSYFVFAVLDKQERRKLLKFAYDHHDDREDFVWCPKKIQDAWLRSRQEQDQFNVEGNGWGDTSMHYNG